MKFSVDSCLKCGVQIIKSGVPLPNYKVLAYKLTTGDIMTVGFCKNCQLESDEYKEAMEAINGFHKPPFKGDIESFYGTEETILKELADKKYTKKCELCGKEIEGEFAITNGKLIHEQCNVISHANVDSDSNAGSVAREHNKMNPRGKKRV